jgi:L-ascorbate metabolism protein UlaG (beta-lactamase superfamily)
MIEPVMKDAALLADMAAVSSEGLHLWWLGQSGFLLQCAGQRLLLDPYLSDTLTVKYASTDKPHVRLTERCLAPETLTGVRVVTASHWHTDHLDAGTLGPLAVANGGIDLLLPHPIVAAARERLGEAPVKLRGLDAGERVVLDGWEVTGVPAAHNDLLRDEAGRCHYLGFLIRREGFTIYHSGDTLWHEAVLRALLAAGQIDLMLLPINGNVPERRVAGNLNGTEAAALAKACGARMVVPCHYDMFAFNTVTPDEFVFACDRLAQPHQVLRCGERLTLALAQSPPSGKTSTAT